MASHAQGILDNRDAQTKEDYFPPAATGPITRAPRPQWNHSR